MALTGSFLMLYLFDVCEEISLDALRRLLGAEPARRQPSFRQPAPDYVRFEKPPVVEPLEPIAFDTGERFCCTIHYYDYGVVCLRLEMPIESGWPQLVETSSRWIAAPELEAKAAGAVDQRLSQVAAALVKPYQPRLDEDYCIIRIDPAQDHDGRPLPAAALMDRYGVDIAQIVRGESAPLSREEQAEVLQSSMSYYPSDLLVVGWTAAFIYDTPEGADATIRLLEYANTQLLEFRHYDEVLTPKLAEVYQILDQGTGPFHRWRLAREAERLNTIQLDVRELTERADTAIKFLSDMFAARLYRLAAAKVGVPDYRRLVDEKLRTAGDLYRFMTDRFHQSSNLVLELMIVLILIIDLVFLFRGKS